MPKIDTIVQDIYDLFNKNVKFPREKVVEFAENLANKLGNRLAEDRGAPTLRLSNLGKPCRRQLWYSINVPELGEPLTAATRIKFLFGDILEELLLFLASVSGHKVERQQEQVEVNGVKGHIDAVIDGELTDAKSASTFSFQTFKNHNLENKDDFGYLTQIGAYGSAVESKQNHFLVVDKQHGHITLDSYPQPDVDYAKIVDETKAMLAQSSPPVRGYSDEPDGKSGNRKLGTACSYCGFKTTCWPGVKTYYMARGPVFLTKVEREPKPRKDYTEE